MLSFLRRHGKSKAIKLLYLAIAVSFVIGFGAFGYVYKRLRHGPQHGENVWAAKVGGVVIDSQTLGHTMQSMERRYREMFGEASAQLIKQMDLPTMALEQLITERIVEKVAENMGLVVTDTELADTIYRMPAFQQDGRFNRKRYVEVLRRYRMNPVEFEAEHRRELLAQKLRQLVASTVKVADAEVYEEFLNREDKVNLRFVKLAPKGLEQQIQMTDAELQQYFAANKAKFKVPEKRTVAYLELRPEEFAADVKVTNEEIENYYQAHADQYKHEEQVHARHILIKVAQDAPAATREAAKKKAEDLLTQIHGGADFAKLVEQNSDDPGSKKKGGDLGWFGRGKMVAAFDEAAFALKPNEVSAVIETQFGYHIIQVLERREGGEESLDSVRDQIKQQLTNEQAMEKAKTRAQELFGLLKPEESLLTFGSQRNLHVAASSAFTADEPIPGVADGMRAARAAFNLKAKEIGEPLATPEAVYILQVTNIVEPHDATFEEVKEKVRDELRKNKIGEVLEKKAKELIAQVQGGASLADAAKKQSLEVKETGLFTRGNASIPEIGAAPALVAAAFAAPAGQGLLPTPYHSGDGVVVCELIEHKKPTDEDYAKKKEEIRDQLAQQKANVTLQAWVEQVQKTVKVVKNEPVLAMLRGRPLPAAPNEE